MEKNIVKKKISTSELVLCALFTALIIVGAFIQIPIPYVPITLQFLFTMLAGIILGGRLGAVSVGTYIALGLIGVPVFTKGGGIHYIFQPTFGYIIGFLVGTYVCGKIANMSAKPSFRRLLVAVFANLVIVYVFGMVHFYFIKNFYLPNSSVTLYTVFLYCFLIPVPGDILLCILSAILGKRIIPYRNANYPKLSVATEQKYNAI